MNLTKDEQRILTEFLGLPYTNDIHCPVCGYYCLGKGGIGCIDKTATFLDFSDWRVVGRMIDKLHETGGIDQLDQYLVSDAKLKEVGVRASICLAVLAYLKEGER